MVAKRLEPNSHAENGQRPDAHVLNGVETRNTTPSTPVTPNIEDRMGEKGGLAPHHPNGWGNYGPPNGSRYQSQENVRDMSKPHEENVVMRRGFVPRTAPRESPRGRAPWRSCSSGSTSGGPCLKTTAAGEFQSAFITSSLSADLLKFVFCFMYFLIYGFGLLFTLCMLV